MDHQAHQICLRGTRYARRIYISNFALASVLLLPACSSDDSTTVTQTSPPAYVGVEVCANCHDGEYKSWRDSHHDLAMQEATDNSVLGDFDDARFRYARVESTFYRRDGRYFIKTDGPDGDVAEYEIAYTFGVEPLQQYLIEFPDGRIQALSICWDTRPAEDGGQHWFHLYPEEEIDHEDILHWTGALQNWNFMCAECHSTNVRKNYALDKDTFATSWAEIDVGCEACHGPGSVHVAWTQGKSIGMTESSGESSVLGLKDEAQWVMNTATGVARRNSPRQSSMELETCARCHSRRSIFSEDYVHGEPLMNTHRPALLTEDLYYADGQIMDEVYVYGSFLQSAMHRAGVSCSDCHNPHSLKLKAPGNAVCAQCHLPAVFDATAHHHHKQDSAGSQCVSCHMPSRNYMVVDARRDHSFRVPRPDLTVRIDTPNACNGCHTNEDAEWAAARVAKWYDSSDSRHYGEILHAGRQGAAGASTELAALAGDAQAPGIVRATAVTLIASNPDLSAGVALERAAKATDALVRMAAADAAQVLDVSDQARIVGPLLEDPVRAVRLAAAGTLMLAPRTALLQTQFRALDATLDEYEAAQELNADRAESHLNMGLLHAAQGDVKAAVEEYQQAVAMMPSFAAAYINMADLYRAAGREDDVDSLLRRGLAAAPDNADLHHALGLSFVRQGQHENAIDLLRKAHELRSNQAHYAYVLGIALNSIGQSGEALAVLRQAHERRPGDRELLFALATISRDDGMRAPAREYAQKLLALSPDDPAARQLLDGLSH